MSAMLAAEILTFDGLRPVPLAGVLQRVDAGELVILRRCVQHLGFFARIHDALREAFTPVIGAARIDQLLREGLEQLHERVSSAELTQAMSTLQRQMAPVGLTMIKQLALDVLGVTGKFYLEESHNVRAFVPEDAWRTAAHEYLQYEKRFSRGKLTLHGTHLDTNYFHPLNAINVWTAIGRVRLGNGMSFFPKFFGKHLPCQDDGCIRENQVLGPALNFSLEPGDAILFHIGHVHGSEINQTAETRFAMSGRFTVGEPVILERPWYNYLAAESIPAAYGQSPPPFKSATATPQRPPITLDTASQQAAPPSCWPGRRAGTWEFRAEELPAGTIRPWNDDYIVVRTDSACFLMARRCPHAGVDLANGYMREECVRCPGHNLRIDPATGASPCRSLPEVAHLACEQRGEVFVTSIPSAQCAGPSAERPQQRGWLGRLWRRAG